MRNEGGTGDLLHIHLLFFGISLFVYFVTRSQTKLSLIKKYHKSLTESSANGLTNLSVFMGMIIIDLIFIVSRISRDVSIKHKFCDVVCLMITVLVL